jgi:hypothetical protein
VLALESSRWSEITHAYGAAADVPELLKAAAQLPLCESVEDGPYFSLWSALCHQGDVYLASYAALPHLVEIARARSARLEVAPFDLIAAIEAARLQGKGPEIPEYLSGPYFAALAALPELAARLLAVPRSEAECRAVLAALAAAKGHGRLAAAIGELSPAVTEALLDHWIFE